MAFLFVPDFSKITSASILAAIGQAFFTLSLGMGTIMTYSASLPKDANLVKSSFSVAFLDTFIAIIAGLVIFAIVFSFGAEPSQGPGLVFVSLPPLFYEMGIAGTLIAFLFFVALAFAGLTSAVSIVEPTAMYMTNRFSVSRLKALLILGIVTYVLGIMALMSNVETLKTYVTFFGMGMFDILDVTTSSILLPLGGFLIAIFVGYVVQKERLVTLFGSHMPPAVFSIWYIILRFIVPVSIVAVMANQLFFS